MAHQKSSAPSIGTSGGAGALSPPRRVGRPRTRPQLTPEQITDVAVRIADTDGLEAVSIRRIAAELDARPMSLYDHFGDKNDLFGAMANQVVAETLSEDPPPADWRQGMVAIARRMYAVYIAHPWLIPIFTKEPRFGPNSTRLATQMAEVGSRLPIEQADIWTVQGMVNDYVLGHSLRTSSNPPPEDLDDVIPQGDLLDHPELATLPEMLRSRARVERFELGLNAMLDGIERRFLEQR